MAVPTFVDYDAHWSWTRTIPAGTQAADVLVCILRVGVGGAPAITAPAGWTCIASSGSVGPPTTGVLLVYYRVAEEGDAGQSAEWTSDPTGVLASCLVVYRGASADAPVAEIGWSGTGTLTTVADESAIIVVRSLNADQACPSGHTLVWYNALYLSMRVCRWEAGAAGDYGPFLYGDNPSYPSQWAVAIAPGAATGTWAMMQAHHRLLIGG